MHSTLNLTTTLFYENSVLFQSATQANSEKGNASAPIKSRTYDLPITSVSFICECGCGNELVYFESGPFQGERKGVTLVHLRRVGRVKWHFR